MLTKLGNFFVQKFLASDSSLMGDVIIRKTIINVVDMN